MDGCLGLVVLVRGILGRLPWVIWLVVSLSVVWVLILLILLLFGPRLNIGLLMILLWKCLILLIFGLMVVERTSLLLVALRCAGVGVCVPASELAFEGSVWGVAEENGDAHLERCRAFMPVPGVVQTVQRAEFWVAFVALQDSMLPGE